MHPHATPPQNTVVNSNAVKVQKPLLSDTVSANFRSASSSGEKWPTFRTTRQGGFFELGWERGWGLLESSQYNLQYICMHALNCTVCKLYSNLTCMHLQVHPLPSPSSQYHLLYNLYVQSVLCVLKNMFKNK